MGEWNPAIVAGEFRSEKKELKELESRSPKSPSLLLMAVIYEVK